jgi:trans-aconitate methyltransferase
MSSGDRRSSPPGRFDARYYRRFYGAGKVHDHRRIAHLATGVHHLGAWWGVRIRSVLDVGAGMGMWRDWYAETHPEVRVRSIDVSEHACTTWGHERRDIATWRPPRPFDLVICHSVLQYLDDAACERAIGNIAAATRHVLYLEIPTRDDLRHLVDPSFTDLDVVARSGSWYRRRLGAHFRQVGAGLWVPLDGTPMFELEAVQRRA